VVIKERREIVQAENNQYRGRWGNYCRNRFEREETNTGEMKNRDDGKIKPGGTTKVRP
jgi:hypothetical protein